MLGSKVKRVGTQPPAAIAAAKKRSLTAFDAFVFPMDQPDEFNFTIVTKEFKYSKKGSGTSPKTTYVLPMPSGIADQTTTEYSEASLGAIGGKIADFANIIAGVGRASGAQAAGEFAANEIGRLVKEGGKKVIDASMSTADVLGTLNAAFGGFIPENVSNVAGVLAGQVPNPHKTVFFKGVNLKNHSFSFNLFPSSAKEADMLKRMINQLRKESLPSQHLAGLSLTYPHEFNLSIQSRGGQHTIMFKPAFCTSVSVNYTPHGPAFMEDGQPAGIGLTMSFSEMDIWRSEDYPTSDTSQAGIAATPTLDRENALEATKNTPSGGLF